MLVYASLARSRVSAYSATALWLYASGGRSRIAVPLHAGVLGVVERRAHGAGDEGEVGDGDDVGARIAVGVAESVQLLEIDVADPGLLR